MRKKALAMTTALALVLSLGLTACGGGADSGTGSTGAAGEAAGTESGSGSGSGSGSAETDSDKVLTIHDSDWEGIDLFQVSSWNDMQMLLADPVLGTDPETKAPTPSIASEFEWSDDGLTWTLTFPEGMYYSTGEQLEPEDFVASVEYGQEVSEYGSGYANIESMEIDGRKVICHLSSFQADMEYNFQSVFVGIIDKDELESLSKDEALWGVHPYGPYYLESYEPGAYAVLKANPGYKTYNPIVTNKGACPVETVRVVFSGEDFTLAQGIQNGDYDVLSRVPSAYLEELQNADSITVTEACGADLSYLEVNITDPILSDSNVRKAIINAINRENLDAYMSDFQSPAYCLVLPKCLNYDAEAESYYKASYDYDPDTAKQLLADAGWADTDNDGYLDKDGQKFTFELDSRDDEDSVRIAQSIAADLADVGIEMTIKTQDWSYVNQDVEDGNFQMAVLGLEWSEPFLLVDRFCQRNPEVTNPDPEGQAAMVAEARSIVDYNDRTKVITDIQKKLFDYCSIIPTADNTAFRCWRSEIQGIICTDTGVFLLNDVVVDDNGNFRNVQ